MKGKFKPNLIPNNPKDGSFDRHSKIVQNCGYDKYFATFKKDGCRLQLIEGKVLTRSLKAPKSKLVVERFQKLAEACAYLNIAIDGEFYMHGLKFNEIFRFFSKADVTCPKYKAKLEKELKKDPAKFAKEYDGRSIKFLTTFHHELVFWLFDGFLTDAPEITGFKERMEEIHRRLMSCGVDFEYLEFPTLLKMNSESRLNDIYNTALEHGWEGLVLTHRDHEYKFGRNSLNQGTILKMKDDAIEYDGIVLDVEESTVVKAGVEKTINELGRSVTSKKKGDREPSGMAKGFVVEFGGLGTFTVSLRDFDHAARKELLENKEAYIGRHFKYTGMAPVKDFPRSAFFDCWRDEKGDSE